ncbi:addiction module antidote protein [Stenotrophomonas maltophilia]
MAIKKNVALQAFDAAEHLHAPKETAAYLDTCIEEGDGDSAFIAKALGDIARAQGMSKVARAAGLSRESLYCALSGERSPDFSTVLKVTRGPRCAIARQRCVSVRADRDALACRWT